MATYTNPNSLLTPVDFKLTGPAAGAMSAIKDAYAFSDMNATNRDQDLMYLQRLNQYENQMADNELIQAKRANELAQQQYEAQDNMSGLNRQLITNKKLTELSNEELKDLKNKAEQSRIGAESFVEWQTFSNKLDEEYGGGALNWNSDPNVQSYYNTLKERAKKAGTPFPDGDPFSPENRGFFLSKYTAAVNGLPSLQKREEAISKAQAQGEYVVNPAVQGRRDVAGIAAETAIRKAELTNDRFTTIESKYTREVSGKTGPLTPEQEGIARDYARVQFEKTFPGKSPMSVFFTLSRSEDKDLSNIPKEYGRENMLKDPNAFLEYAREKFTEDFINTLKKERGQSESKPKPVEESPRTQSNKLTNFSRGKGNELTPQEDRPDLRAKGYKFGVSPINGQIGWYK